MELLLMLDAARGASAARITAVIPHYAYARSDKKDAPRISIAARLVADLLVTAGANRVLTMTLHSPQVHGFFSVPVDHLNALDVLARHFRKRDWRTPSSSRPIWATPSRRRTSRACSKLPVAAGSKQRLSDDRVVIDAIVGRRGRQERHRDRRRDRQRRDDRRSAAEAARAPVSSALPWPARTVCSPGTAIDDSTHSRAGYRRDRDDQHRADPAREALAELRFLDKPETARTISTHGWRLDREINPSRPIDLTLSCV